MHAEQGEDIYSLRAFRAEKNHTSDEEGKVLFRARNIERFRMTTERGL